MTQFDNCGQCGSGGVDRHGDTCYDCRCKNQERRREDQEQKDKCKHKFITKEICIHCDTER